MEATTFPTVQRVLVTGGAAGIGRAVADAFVAAGARVHVADADPEACASLPSEMTHTVCDVSRPEAVDELFAAADAALAGLDVLVNNVGISGPTGGIETLDAGDWDRTLAVNLRSHFLCSAAAVPRMRDAGGGSLVFISSTAGTHGYPLRTPYAASKWAVVGLSASLAMELGEFGIRSNVVAPGTITNDRMDRVIAAEAAATGASEGEIRARYTDQVSMRTLIDPQDIAMTVVFLASPDARYITGQVLSVDGGTETLRTTFRT